MVKVPMDRELKAEITVEIKEDIIHSMYNVMRFTTDCRLALETPLPLGVVDPTELISRTNVIQYRVFPVAFYGGIPGNLNHQLDAD